MSRFDHDQVGTRFAGRDGRGKHAVSQPCGSGSCRLSTQPSRAAVVLGLPLRITSRKMNDAPALIAESGGLCRHPR